LVRRRGQRAQLHSTPTEVLRRHGDGRKLSALVMDKRSAPTEVFPQPATNDFWDECGVWHGPCDVRFFLRHNRGFAPFYMLLFAGLISVPIWAMVRHVFAPFVVMVLAAVLTLLCAFVYSRGWVGPGDGDA
jgi:hypothetical protein